MKPTAYLSLALALLAGCSRQHASALFAGQPSTGFDGGIGEWIFILYYCCWGMFWFLCGIPTLVMGFIKDHPFAPIAVLLLYIAARLGRRFFVHPHGNRKIHRTRSEVLPRGP